MKIYDCEEGKFYQVSENKGGVISEYAFECIHMSLHSKKLQGIFIWTNFEFNEDDLGNGWIMNFDEITKHDYTLREVNIENDPEYFL